MKYIREKGKWAGGEKKFVIEEEGKYIKTIPKVEELCSLLCLDIQSCSPKEEKTEIEEKPSKSSSIPYLNEHQFKDGKGILIPLASEEGNRDSVTWSCDKCSFKTDLIFEDRKCPKCSQKIQEELNKLMKDLI